MSMRDISFEGAFNFRDLGGYATASGQRTRWGKLYRAAELATLTDDDLHRLEALGIKFLFDLRSSNERESRPNRLAEQTLIRRGHRDYAHSAADLTNMQSAPEVAGEALRQLMLSIYRELPYSQGDSYRTVFHAVASGDVPLLFHCAAGKDRTGVLAALLLELAGVPRDVIVEDYVLTNREFERLQAKFLSRRRQEGIDDDAWTPMLRADPAYLLNMFDALDSANGGTRGYFGELGLTDDHIGAIRAQLLEDVK